MQVHAVVFSVSCGRVSQLTWSCVWAQEVAGGGTYGLVCRHRRSYARAAMVVCRGTCGRMRGHMGSCAEAPRATCGGNCARMGLRFETNIPFGIFLRKALWLGSSIAHT